MRTSKRFGSTRARRTATRIIGYAVLVFFSLVFIYPFVIQLANTFKSEADATANPLSPVPHPFTDASFLRIFDSTDFPRWMFNSVLVTVIVTLGRVFFDSLAGYALARLRFRGRAGIFATVVAMMAVPGVVLLIPKFLVLKQLGLYNSYGGLILPLLVDATGVFIMKQMFESIPAQMEEAARIDGAGIFRTYWSVVLPLARPALITLTILSFQGSWNEPGGGAESAILHASARAGRPGRRIAGLRHAISTQARRRAASDDPGGDHLPDLPAALRTRCERGRRQRLGEADLGRHLAELAQQAEEVGLAPEADDLTVGDLIHLDPALYDVLAGGVVAVRAVEVGDDAIFGREQLDNLDASVAQAGTDHRTHRKFPADNVGSGAPDFDVLSDEIRHPGGVTRLVDLQIAPHHIDRVHGAQATGTGRPRGRPVPEC